jgi:predicted PurR-regulated permease PerM
MTVPASPGLDDTAQMAAVPEDAAQKAAVPGEAAVPAPPTVPVRNVALYLLVIFATIGLLYWAQLVFIPLVLGFIVSYALAPVIDRLQKLGVPRGLSSAILLVAIVLGIGASAYSLRDEAVRLVESLPEAVAKIQAAAREEFAGPRKTIEKVQKAAQEIERATEDRAFDVPAPGVRQVQVVRPKLDVRQYLATTVTSAMAFSGLALIVILLAYFLLASGDAFRRKWVQLSGPTLARRRITVQVMDEIASQIQHYLAVQVFTSAIVGVASGLAFWAIGLDNAAVWGIAAGVLNLVPYLGAIVTTAGTALVAFFQFGTVGMALGVAAISLVINSIEGYWLTPWLSGRASRMNNVVVFSGLLFWGWLWGGWGVILGLPIMMVVKSVCDHVEHLKPIGDFMGE